MATRKFSTECIAYKLNFHNRRKADFIGYNDKYLIEYNRILELIKDAILNRNYQQLELEAERAQKTLEDKFGTTSKQQENLETHLLYEHEKDLSYLLKEVKPKNLFNFL